MNSLCFVSVVTLVQHSVAVINFDLDRLKLSKIIYDKYKSLWSEIKPNKYVVKNK